MYIFFFFHLAKFVDHVKGNKLTKHLFTKNKSDCKIRYRAL